MEKVTKVQIIDVVNQNLEDTSICNLDEDVDLAKKGMDSISFIKIIVGLEEKFDCEIPDSKLIITEMNTVNKMFDFLVMMEEAK